MNKTLSPQWPLTRSSSANMEEEVQALYPSEKTIPLWGNTPSVVASLRSKKISISCLSQKYRRSIYHTQSWSYWATIYCGNTLSGSSNVDHYSENYLLTIWRQGEGCRRCSVYALVEHCHGRRSACNLLMVIKTLSHDDLTRLWPAGILFWLLWNVLRRRLEYYPTILNIMPRKIPWPPTVSCLGPLMRHTLDGFYKFLTSL